MNTVSIRAATANDAELIADLSRETFYNAFRIHNTEEDMDKFMTETFTRKKLMDELTLPNNIFLLAYNDDEVAGYVRLRDKNLPEVQLNTDNVIEVARIYTVSSQIGKGIGSELMTACLNIAKERQRKFIWLGVWEKNDKAIRFYERFGFKKFGAHEFILGNDVQTDWLMGREV
jgi:ribosomal protein S18 acetylase RimI-like enzyme